MLYRSFNGYDIEWYTGVLLLFLCTVVRCFVFRIPSAHCAYKQKVHTYSTHAIHLYIPTLHY
jgi:hypothetical protein